ncbi:MAG: AAA domain-containing protein, partial [Acidimicrobiales bacterium]|nr:AAA domain-containing protein [Acidimicrobiales bacterium]
GVVGSIVVSAGSLIAPGHIRARAQLAWADIGDETRAIWQRRGSAAGQLGLTKQAFGVLADQLQTALNIEDMVANYLLGELAMEGDFAFATSPGAAGLVHSLRKDRVVASIVSELDDDIGGAQTVLTDYLQRTVDLADAHQIPEVVAALLTPSLPRRVVEVDMAFSASGLLGQHATVVSGTLTGRVDEIAAQVHHHIREVMPAHKAFGRARRTALAGLRRKLRIDDLEPRVPEGFVRNQLIDKVYLPLIGDNLARQIGTVEDRTGSRSGLLMLLSPPGYGKTTLVEYLADRLGMALVKVSGPGLGHDVTSLDPAQATSATAAREIDRINMAFAVGTNVILYLDDIQHTSPEFLQRFISLCDGQRRIEGVWNGESRTFDLRGKRFAVIMAGNPYTESGQRFQIPDMLANRADTYNLGDVVGGNDELFARSYLENALTSHPVLAQLAGSAPEDFNAFLRATEGEPLSESTLAGSYSSAEINEMVATLGHLRQVQETVLKVNRQYIASAATDDAYRTEPPFLLQGSYRNMVRLASKLVPAMNSGEVEALLDDHYVAESQALTGAAEANLLKLAELRGQLNEETRVRWAEIKATFARKQRLGGGDADPVTRVVAAIESVSEALQLQDPLAARAIDLLASTANDQKGGRSGAPEKGSTG